MTQVRLSWTELMQKAKRFGIEVLCNAPSFKVTRGGSPEERFTIRPAANTTAALGGLSIKFHQDFAVEYWLIHEGKLVLGAVPTGAPGKPLGGLSLHNFVMELLVLAPAAGMQVVRVLRTDEGGYFGYTFTVFSGSMTELIAFARTNGLKR